MNRAFAGLLLVGLTASLGACVYYPHGPYGPGYGPPPPPGYGAPPPGAEYGPPPEQQPPPGYNQEAPPPGYGGPQQNGEMRPLTQDQIAKMNDPNWCATYAHRCQKLRARYAAQQQGGPPPRGQYGPPPQGQYQGPPPNSNQGPPPDDE